jgi:hypothetical protein
MKRPALSRSARRRPSPADLLLSWGFLVLIGLPLLLLGSGSAGLDTVAFEYRSPAPWPGLPATAADWQAWPRAVEAHFGDRFGLRGDFLRLRARLRWDLLGGSPTPTAVQGRAGEVFLTADRVLDTWSGRSPLSPREVDAWLASLTQRADHLAARGIVYLAVFVPDKTAVYPERVPASLGPAGRRRLDQLVESAAGAGFRNLLDLTPALRKERAADRDWDRTYPALGSHWTARGALAGALAIGARLRELGADWVDLDQSRMRFEPAEDTFGDSYAARLYLAERLDPTGMRALLPAEDLANCIEGAPDSPLSLWSGPRAAGPRLLVFHDSFGPELRPLLSASCALARWVWKPYDARLVREFAPDVVLELFVERQLAMRLAHHGDEGNQAALAAAFAEAPRGLRLDAAELAARLRCSGGLVATFDAPSGSLLLSSSGSQGLGELSLARWPADRPTLLCLSCASNGEGQLVARYLFRDGSPAYPVESIQREAVALWGGKQPLWIPLAPERIGQTLTLSFEPGHAELRIEAAELRIWR